MSVNLRGLIAKLNAPSRSGIEAAAGLCLSRTNYDVEIEHFLVKLMDATDTDVAAILSHFGVNRSRLADDLARALDRLKSGNARTPSLSPTLVKVLSEAWLLGSVEYGAPRVRTGHCLLALVTNPELSRLAYETSAELEKIASEVLKKDFVTITAPTAEAAAELGSIDAMASSASASTSGAPTKAGGRTPNLDQYTVDMTANAKAGKIDPVLGRDAEVRQVVDILTRRRQNNPILVGEAGVGKTAIVEGFARRIAEGDVPPPLRNVSLRSLDLAMLQAGAGVKGEFENRLKGLIAEVKNSPTPIILFIDEAHTMIGAGGAAGQNDAANLLKPALARGELRTIAATTWSEYKKFFEKDPALSRRFQLVKVDEPTEDLCLVMMRGVVPALEKHHNVRILDGGTDAAVRLSHRYLPDRQLPDKAVSVLDTACARLALGHSSTPAAIEDARRTLDDLALQERVLRREQASGGDHQERLESISKQRDMVTTTLAALEQRWGTERELVEKIRVIRDTLELNASGDQVTEEAATAAVMEAPANAARANAAPATATPANAAPADVTEDAPQTLTTEPAPAAMPEAKPDAPGDVKLREELTTLNAELAQLQGETPLVRGFVDASIIGEVISGWTGIPVGKMMRDELSTMLELEVHLGARVIGQDHALLDISRRVRTSKAGIEDPDKPKGVFMLVGPSGVGKTETALALSDLLYGGERNIITINMSEFQEAHTVSTLKGSPPGYVGYGEGGVLTEAVRRRPYSVVLLDEVEKAHPDVLELFFQVFDKGVMDDGEGRTINFRNTVIILTTNAGTETIMNLTSDPDTMPFPEALAKALKPELNAVFKPAFLGRMVIVPYYPVRDENLKQIVRLKIGKIKRRLRETHGIELLYDESLVQQVAARCTEVESGARNVDNILSNTVLPEISRLLLASMAEGLRPTGLRIDVGTDGDFSYAPVVNTAAV